MYHYYSHYHYHYHYHHDYHYNYYYHYHYCVCIYRYHVEIRFGHEYYPSYMPWSKTRSKRDQLETALAASETSPIASMAKEHLLPAPLPSLSNTYSIAGIAILARKNAPLLHKKTKHCDLAFHIIVLLSLLLSSSLLIIGHVSISELAYEHLI